MAGAGMNLIKARIKSVNSTLQITGAMELVATSKLRRAKEKVERTRPFYLTLGEAIDNVIAAADVCKSDYVKPREVKKTLYIVIAGDRGLAGGYNSSIFKMTKQLAASGESVILPIGKKACEHFRSASSEFYPISVECVDDLGVGEALSIGNTVSEGYLAGEYDRVVLVYTRFVSMITQTPVYEQLLPLEREGMSCGGNVEYDLCPDEMLASIVPAYVGGVLYSAICESLASESGARRTAMNAANKNASEIIDSLVLKFNRARQAIITQEITEIVSGAEAL